MAIDFDDLPPVGVFGTWDAPVTDGGIPIDVPERFKCIYCHEHFREGDNGAVMPTGFAQHRECSLRSVYGGIGHHVDHARYCRSDLGPDAGLPHRVSSWLVWRMFTEGVQVTEEKLAALRDGAAILCVRCGWVSHHPEDVRHGYCGNCHDFTGRADG